MTPQLEKRQTANSQSLSGGLPARHSTVMGCVSRDSHHGVCVVRWLIDRLEGEADQGVTVVLFDMKPA